MGLVVSTYYRRSVKQNSSPGDTCQSGQPQIGVEILKFTAQEQPATPEASKAAVKSAQVISGGQAPGQIYNSDGSLAVQSSPNSTFDIGNAIMNFDPDSITGQITPALHPQSISGFDYSNTVYSINDAFSEQTISYVCADFTPLAPLSLKEMVAPVQKDLVVRGGEEKPVSRGPEATPKGWRRWIRRNRRGEQCGVGVGTRWTPG